MMALADIILGIVGTGLAASLLFWKEDEIQKWANSKHGRKLEWRD